MLSLLAQGYRLGVKVRLLLYRRGCFSVRRLDRPVISVGNLSLGGTGKTPMVMDLAGRIAELGYAPVILSRGYGGSLSKTGAWINPGGRRLYTERESGDEPYLMAGTLSQVPVLVGRDRYAAARRLLPPCPKRVYLLDDGFQHLQLYRDIDLVLLDATDPWAGGRLLPAGRLRELPGALERADQILVTRSHLVPDRGALQTEIRQYNAGAPIWFFSHNVARLRDVRSGQQRSPEEFRGEPVAALAALARPAVFEKDLRRCGMLPVQSHFYQDHARLSQAELERVLKAVRAGGARAIMTTEKDAVKLESLRFPAEMIFAVQIEVRSDERESFDRELAQRLSQLEQAAGTTGPPAGVERS